MKLIPNEYEIEQAVELLVNKFNVSASLLGQLFGTGSRDQANEILRLLGNSRLNRAKVARMLIHRKGSALLSGSSNEVKRLRRLMLTTLPFHELSALFAKHAPNSNSVRTASYMITPLAEKRWHSGGMWPKNFVRAVGLPLIFAGIKQQSSNKTIVDVEPLTPLPELVEFQVKLKEQMLEVLELQGDKTRSMVTLPTGGGKTRVAVEAFIDWMQPRFSEGKYLVWIAQSEELCEQAIKCIEQMWSGREYISTLRIYRFFGNREIPVEELRGGVVVASIQKLFYRTVANDESLTEILKGTGAMIIDEAHRAVSSMYDSLLSRAEEICPELFPICGLTATPGRSCFTDNLEISKLVDRFDAYLIKPDLGREYATDPVRYFRENRYLAKANHLVFPSGREYTLTDDEINEPKHDHYELLSPGFLNRLASDNRRNLVIINKLLSLPKGTPTLVYACSVEHASLLSVILIENGRTAGVISAETPMTIRRGLIQAFKSGEVEFLCNFGVLTTGFDAPATECIVICRPTTSEILYEQIIGRGLRGPRFGGTEECTIIDFADNIHRLGKSIAYARFTDYWDSDKVET